METATPQGHDSTLKRIRKGTKSCIECRQRKTRCIWPEGDRKCTGCKTRGKECVPQIYQKRSIATDRVTSRDRISRLEQQIANIAAAVQEKQPGSGSLPSTSPNNGSNDHAMDTTQDEDGHDPSLEGPATDPPSHLKFLFENPLIGPSQRSSRNKGTPKPPCSPQYLDSARARLQLLLPTRRDVEAIRPLAAEWMRLYTGLFPALLKVGSPQQMVDMLQEISGPSADPIRIAMFLMAFTMTARQLPSDQQILSFRDVRAFTIDVLGTIESVIVSHTGYQSTVEGLSATVMHCRLQLGLGKVRPVWLQLRRTVALAEIIGLPRSYYGQNSDADNEERKALWDTICATDRLSSMLFNLPAATVTHRFARKKLIDENGGVITQAFMFEIATLAMRIQEIDENSLRGDPLEEVYDRVLHVDKDLRGLKASTPSSWWTIDETQGFGPHHLIQFWYTYVAVRTHLRMATSKDEHDQCAYSRMACYDAAKAIASRYAFVRPKLPAGFFACRIIDMQIFTVAVYLLMSSYDPTLARAVSTPGPYRDDTRLALVQQILDTMDSVSDQVGAEFAREAASAFRGLQAMLESSDHSHPEGVTLRIPLLGQIHVGGRSHAETRPPLAQPASTMYEPPRSTSASDHGEIRIPAVTNSDYIPQQQHAFAMPYGTTGYESMPWLLELDMNSSSLQDPWIGDGFDGFDGWMDDGFGI